MNGQITILNAVSEKDNHTNSVERQSLPEKKNSFAMLMAGKQSAQVAASEKKAVKDVSETEKKADAEGESSDTEKTKKNGKQALNDVLPQLSVKDIPLTVTKNTATNDTDSKDLSLSQTSADEGHVDLSSLVQDSTVSGSVDSAEKNATTTDTSSVVDGSSVNPSPSPQDLTDRVSTDQSQPAEVAGVEASVSSTTANGQQSVNAQHTNVNVAHNLASQGKPDGQTTVNNGVATGSVSSEVTDASAKQSVTALSQAASVSNMSKSGVDSQVVASQQPKPLAINANNTTPAQNVNQTVSSTMSDASLSGQAGQQSFQQGSQQGQGGQAPFSQNSLMQQIIQAQQNSAQQAAVKQFSDAAAMNADAKVADSAKLLGNLGVGFDARTQLPAGLQGIAASLRSPQWGQALGQRVVYMAANKVSEAKITLNPEKLGPVQIKLHVDKNQQVHVAMTAHHHTTKDTMEASIPKLKEMMEAAGIDFGAIDVNQDSQFEAQQQNTNGDRSGNGTTGSNQGVDTEVEEGNTSSIAIKQSDSIVDYYA